MNGVCHSKPAVACSTNVAKKPCIPTFYPNVKYWNKKLAKKFDLFYKLIYICGIFTNKIKMY